MLTKITNADREGKGVTGLADTPELDTSSMQAKFDELGNLGIDGMNRMIDELTSDGSETESGASNIGATVPSGVIANGNVQSVIDALVNVVNANTAGRHTHANKATLDEITADNKAAYDRLVTLLNTILTVETETASNTATAIATSAAVLRTLDSYAFMELKRTMYPVGSLFFNKTGTNPAAALGGTWVEEYDLFPASSGVYAYRRTS